MPSDSDDVVADVLGDDDKLGPHSEDDDAVTRADNVDLDDLETRLEIEDAETQPALDDADTQPEDDRFQADKFGSQSEEDKHDETVMVPESAPESPVQNLDQPPLTPLPINPSLDRNHLANQKSSKSAKRSGFNGFRMFAKQYRLDHPDECKQAVSAVSKIVGAAWKALPDDERAEWNRMAAEQAPSAPDDAKSPKEKDAQKLGSHLQMSRVKGIMQLDPEVHHISKEAVEFVRAGAELFIGFMCKTAAKYCGSRHSIQFADFRQTIKTEPKLKFLLGAFNKNNSEKQTTSIRTPASKRGRNSTTDCSGQPPAKTSKITSFFQKVPAA